MIRLALFTVSYCGLWYKGKALSLKDQILKAGELGFDGLSIETKRPVALPCTENCTDMGWEIYPQGLRRVLNWAYKLYRRPLMVTENGIADAKDEKRSDYLISHIREIYKAIVEDGVPVKGYFHWSLTDNFEWARGFKMRFGLYRVDYETKERKPTKAVPIYKRIATGSL